MELRTFSAFGDLSDEVGLIVRRIGQKDLTDPLNIVESDLDWSVYYTDDGEPLSGDPNEAFPDGRPSLTFSQWTGSEGQKNYVDVYIDGAATRAHNVPLRFSAISPTAAVLIRQVPRLGGGKQIQTDCALIFKMPGDTSPIVKRWRQNIQ